MQHKSIAVVAQMIGGINHIVEIDGEAGLRSAGELAEKLRSAVANSHNITVSLDAATAIDITTLQLLAAARKSALAAGKSLRLRARPDGLLRQMLVKTGFVSAGGKPLTPEGTFWIDTGPSSSEAA